MSANLVAALYLVSGVLFILALRGLSSPATSRRGNLLGMIGMAIAMGTTLAIATPQLDITWYLIAGGIGIGGLIGAITARRIPMTAMPELVAAFHSLVGLAAVFVAAAALYAPDSFGIGERGGINVISLIEMSLGVAIGAIAVVAEHIARDRRILDDAHGTVILSHRIGIVLTVGHLGSIACLVGKIGGWVVDVAVRVGIRGTNTVADAVTIGVSAWRQAGFGAVQEGVIVAVGIDVIGRTVAIAIFRNIEPVVVDAVVAGVTRVGRGSITGGRARFHGVRDAIVI